MSNLYHEVRGDILLQPDIPISGIWCAQVFVQLYYWRWKLCLQVFLRAQNGQHAFDRDKKIDQALRQKAINEPQAVCAQISQRVKYPIKRHRVPCAHNRSVSPKRVPSDADRRREVPWVTAI